MAGKTKRKRWGWVEFQAGADRRLKSPDRNKEGEYIELVFPVEPSLANLPSIHVGILGFLTLTPLMAVKFPLGDSFGPFSECSYF